MSQQHDHENMNEDGSKAKRYWRNLEEYTRDPNLPALPDAEFASSPTSDGDDQTGLDSASRRDFLKVMGAGFALMGASACTRRPVEKIVPYVKAPEDVKPGISNWYASASADCPCRCGVLVRTREGRPIKFEGNPKHPVNQGGLCIRAQASVLSLYDPDRLQGPVTAGRKGEANTIKWEELDAALVEKIRAGRGKVRVLTGELLSPSTNKLIQEFVSSVGGKHVTYDVLGAENVLAASEQSYGSRVLPHYHFEKAKMILAFGADFLGSWISPSEFNRMFAKTRKVGKNAPKGEEKTMSRFVAFEAAFTLTGSNADDRYRLKSGDEYKAALAIAHELIVAQSRTRFAGNGDVTSVLSPYAIANIATQLGVPAEALRSAANDLWQNRGKSLVVGGGNGVTGEMGTALEVAVNLLNSALENDGVTIDATASPRPVQTSYADLAGLVNDMKTGQVDVLILYKTNPIYALPPSLGFADALTRVKTVVSFTERLDETARLSDYVAAAPHSTEAWGDSSPYSGVFSVQQPTISPLYNTRGIEDSLMIWAKRLGAGGAIASTPNWHEYLMSSWKDLVHGRHGVGTPYPLFWEQILREGAYDGTSRLGPSRARSFSTAALRALPKLSWSKDITLVMYPKSSLYDGTGSDANNGWLHELPDPITKVTWDNHASISPAMAKTLGVKDGDVVRLKTQAGTVEIPALVQAGMHDQTIGVQVGYGRVAAGRVGNDVGVNVYPLALAGGAMSGMSVTVEKTGAHSALATTQRHNSMEGRAIVREAGLKKYQHNPKAGNEHHHKIVTLWPKYEYPGYRWGMAIDLNSCTGCSACIIGCQSENNIPVVGKRFVLDSKEMHWLRIDRYYSGSAENPETVHQPMLCQHCENAPCETVCPVLATVHDHEGLNQQVYNRCVGTRYCANNCPYKVRRFNWFTFTDYAKPMNLVFNPDITVRTRGVMEKCTFCIQRIREAKDHAKDFATKIKDGELKTACQQSCPTDAIIFGDINDKNTRVSQISSDPRGYHVLEELNTRPSVTYLTKIRNAEVEAGHSEHKRS